MQLSDLFDALDLTLPDGIDTVQVNEKQWQLMVLFLLSGIESAAGAAAVATADKVTPITMVKLVAATGTPERATAVATLCTGFSITGQKARATDNTGNVFFGWTSANDSQLEILYPGQTRSMTAARGTVFDLRELYIDVLNVNDGVMITYNPAP